MDEHHTQEALDALADLFLTGTAPVNPSPHSQSLDDSSPGKSKAAGPNQLGPPAIVPSA